MKEEPVDILDEQGNKTGQTMLKSEAHKQGLWHGGAHLWIYNSKGEVLLQLRSPNKVIRPNFWDVSVAGHIKSGGSPKTTLIREAKEELCLDVEPKNFNFIGVKQVDEQMPTGWHHRVFNWTYLVQQEVDISKLKLEEGEVEDAVWLPVNEFEAELKDPQKSKKYTPSRLEFYNEIIKEVRERLQNGEEN